MTRRASVSCLVCVLAVMMATLISADGIGVKRRGVEIKPKVKPKDHQAQRVVDQFSPRYNLAVRVVRLADDDGSNASQVTKLGAEDAIRIANHIYRQRGGDVQFYLDPTANPSVPVMDTVMNHDCRMAPGQTPETIRNNKRADLNNDGIRDGKDAAMLCDPAPAAKARTAYALQFPHSIVVLSRGSREHVKWNEDTKPHHWEVGYGTGGFSGGNLAFVAMPDTLAGSNLLAHELGHYLHLCHTHNNSYDPANTADLIDIILDYEQKHPGQDATRTFDGDGASWCGVQDTPADPRSGVFTELYGEHCDPDHGTVSISVPQGQGSAPNVFTFAPDRQNIMSYFKGCPFTFHLTQAQYVRIHTALLPGGNRHLLTVPAQRRCGPLTAKEKADLENLPADQKLQFLSRRLVDCMLLRQIELPHEIVEVYSRPEAAVRGMRRFNNLMVNRGLERTAIDRLVDTSYNRCE